MSTTNAQPMMDIGAKHLARGRGPTQAALGVDGTELLATVRKTLSTTAQQSAGVAEDVAGHLSNDMLPRDGRERLARERREKATAAVKDGNEKALAAIEVTRRKLEQAATPRPPKYPAAVALVRDEVRMVIDSAESPYDAAVALAQGNDRDAAALIASPWGERLLASKGMTDAGVPLRLAAIEGSRQYGTDQQRAAAEALDTAMIDLSKAQGAVRRRCHHSTR